MRFMTGRVKRLEEHRKREVAEAFGPCRHCAPTNPNGMGGPNRRLAFMFEGDPPPTPNPCPRCGGDLNDIFVIMPVAGPEQVPAAA